ncbi:hypothetical protein V4X05_004666 [Escherichia coli]
MVTATHLRPSRQKCVVARITGTLPVVVIEVYVYEKILQAISDINSVMFEKDFKVTFPDCISLKI